MNRRLFLTNASAMATAFIVLAKSSKLRAFDSLCAQDLDGQISNNHGHEVILPQSDVMAGLDKEYSIQGVSGHPHMINISTEQFLLLRQTGRLEVTSSTDFGHSHTVTFICEVVS